MPNQYRNQVTLIAKNKNELDALLNIIGFDAERSDGCTRLCELDWEESSVNTSVDIHVIKVNDCCLVLVFQFARLPEGLFAGLENLINRHKWLIIIHWYYEASQEITGCYQTCFYYQVKTNLHKDGTPQWDGVMGEDALKIKLSELKKQGYHPVVDRALTSIERIKN